MNRFSLGLPFVLVACASTGVRAPSGEAKVSFTRSFVTAHTSQEMGFFELEIENDPANAAQIAQLNQTGDEVERVLNRVSSKLTPYLKIPSKLALVLSPRFDNAFYNDVDSSLHVSRELVDDLSLAKPHSKAPKFREAVWVHEFGHAVLFANLPSCVDGIEKRRRKLRSRVGDLFADLADASERQDAQAAARIGILLAKYQTVEGGYQEFFADVIAVLDSGDVDVIMKGMTFAGDKRTFQQKARSFGGKRFTVKALRATDSVHTVLAPARTYVGKYFLDGGRFGNPNLTPTGWTVARIQKAVCDEMSRVYALVDARESFEANLDLTTWERALNARLISAVDASFKACPSVDACP